MPYALFESNIKNKLNLLWNISAWDFFTGIPAGMLIFMSTILGSAILSKNNLNSSIAPMIVQAAASILAGTLAGITRLKHGPATGLCAGFIAAGITGYLWMHSQPMGGQNSLFIGPAGMLTTVLLSPLGGYVGAKIRKAI